VNSPSASSVPPTISIAPANQDSDSIAGAGFGEGGKPSSFWVPCSRKISAATMRSTLSRRGAHTVDSSEVFIGVLETVWASP